MANATQDKTMQWVCPNCHGELKHATLGQRHQIVCNTCRGTYPSIEGRIPVLVLDSESCLTSSFLELNKIACEIEFRERAIKKLLRLGSKRSQVLKQILEVYRAGISFVKKLVSMIEPNIKASDVFIHERQESSGDKYAAPKRETAYTNPLLYLRRDWSQLPEAEQEISKIMEAFRSGVGKILSSNESALVLGAGGGRIAWELCQYFQKVFAIDRSASLVSGYHVVSDAEVDLPVVIEDNRPTKKDFVIPSRLSIPKKKTNDTHKSMYYCVADALSTPLEDHSVNAVISVYFTDVVPLNSLVYELRRILKPGGMFFHFGPLMYHFSHLGDKLSAEEVREVFEEAGFKITTEQWVPGLHLHIEENMEGAWFRNWVFHAFLGEKSTNLGQNINDQSIMEINGKVAVKSQSLLGSDDEIHESIELSLPTGRMCKVSPTVLQFLRYVDGKATFASIIKKMDSSLDLNNGDEKALMKMAINLIQNGMIRIKGR